MRNCMPSSKKKINVWRSSLGLEQAVPLITTPVLIVWYHVQRDFPNFFDIKSVKKRPRHCRSSRFTVYYDTQAISTIRILTSHSCTEKRSPVLSIASHGFPEKSSTKRYWCRFARMSDDIKARDTSNRTLWMKHKSALITNSISAVCIVTCPPQLSFSITSW